MKRSWAFFPLALIAIVSAAPARADLYSIQGSALKISIEPPPGWVVLRDKLRSPFLIAGPQSAGSGYRPVINIFPIQGMPEDVSASLDSKAFERSERDYERSKRTWVNRKGGKILGFSPHSSESWPHVGEVQSFGVSYRLGDAGFSERTSYLRCEGSWFMIQLLLPDGHEKPDFERSAIGALRGFNCSR